MSPKDGGGGGSVPTTQLEDTHACPAAHVGVPMLKTIFCVLIARYVLALYVNKCVTPLTFLH